MKSVGCGSLLIRMPDKRKTGGSVLSAASEKCVIHFQHEFFGNTTEDTRISFGDTGS